MTNLLDMAKAKKRLISALAKNRNVIGIGIGYATKNRQVTGEVALVVFVKRKLPLDAVAPECQIPQVFQKCRVDVVQYSPSRPCNCRSRHAG